MAMSFKVFQAQEKVIEALELFLYARFLGGIGLALAGIQSRRIAFHFGFFLALEPAPVNHHGDFFLALRFLFFLEAHMAGYERMHFECAPNNHRPQ